MNEFFTMVLSMVVFLLGISAGACVFAVIFWFFLKIIIAPILNKIDDLADRLYKG